MNDKKKVKKSSAIKRGRGAPTKPHGDKKRPDGLTNIQYARLQEEVAIRPNVDSVAALVRQIVDWWLEATDANRGGAEAFKMFDDVQE